MDVAHEDSAVARRHGLWAAFLDRYPVRGTLGPEIVANVGNEIQHAGLVQLTREDLSLAIGAQFEEKVRYQFFGPVFFGRLGPNLAGETERLRAIASPSGHGPSDAVGMLGELLRIGGLLARVNGQSDEPRQEIHLYGRWQIIAELPDRPDTRQ
jgi:hypothetical protein